MIDNRSFPAERRALVDYGRHRAVDAFSRWGTEASCGGGGSAFVECCEFLKVEWLSCVALDALYDALAADGAVVRNVVVHTAVLL